MKVVVIDDDLVVLQVAKAALEKAGHEVVTLSTAIGATAVLLRERPEAVLVDIDMPALNGNDWLQLIRERNLLGEDRQIGFILYSGAEREELDRLVSETGALGGIQKSGDITGFALAFSRITQSL